MRHSLGTTFAPGASSCARRARVRSGLTGETVLPLFVDAGPYADPSKLPIGGVTIIDLPNSHLQYAVTWYGLAAALVAVSGVFLWRRMRAS